MPSAAFAAAIGCRVFARCSADGRVRDAATKGLRALNQKIHDDKRVDAVLLTIGDGVMLARRRG